jgi:L-ascorbate metabolism protein UlaG (beta-lactamase superfamily)
VTSKLVRATALWIASTLLWATACGVEGDPAASSHAEPERSSSTPPRAKVHYLANAGVLIAGGDTKIVFDPLFRNDFGTYRLLPEALERALFAGETPFDGLDAVFISHYHEDHFSPGDVFRLLKERPDIKLYAPVQAVAEMKRIPDDDNYLDVFARVTEIALDHGDEPITIEAGDLIVEASRIPHTGWPDRLLDVENIAYRVTIDQVTTVLHLGDADTRDVHFARDAEYWDRRRTHMAFPPYWYFQSEDGRSVLEHRLKPEHAVGIHVPVEIPRDPAERPADLKGYDLFVEPGETRDIP